MKTSEAEWFAAEMKLLTPEERRSVMAARKADKPDPLFIPDHVNEGSPQIEPGRVIREL